MLKLRADLATAQELLASGDGELAELARQEIAALEPEVATLERSITELLTPHDPLDDRDAIVEIRAGTGGDEAALFAAELFRMYTRFAENKGWRVEVLSMSGVLPETVTSSVAAGSRTKSAIAVESSRTVAVL